MILGSPCHGLRLKSMQHPSIVDDFPCSRKPLKAGLRFIAKENDSRKFRAATVFPVHVFSRRFS